MAISCGDQTPAPAPTPGNPNTDNSQNPNPGNPGNDNSQNPNPGNPGGGTVDPVEAAKTEAKTAIDAATELSDSVKEALKRQVEATTTADAARDLKTKAEALVSAVRALSGSVTKAKEAKNDAEYSKVTDTLKTTLEEKYTAATALLEDGTKLKNLDASSNLDTTKASLESAKTDLDAAVDSVKPELEFQKTKTSAAAKVTELDALVNIALKAELQRQVNELTKEQAAQATTMLANLTSLKESLESLQTLVSDGLKMQVDYPQKYYDADNKADFDAALLKASSVFPAFQWTAQSIVVPQPEEGALPNPRAWTKAREKSEFVLQNFIMAPAQAAAPTQTEPAAVESASATVRVATGTEETETEEAAEDSESSETQTPAPTPVADLASTASYLKSLSDSLKAETDKLNGDTTKNKTAYYKVDADRTLYWDGFMPKIVLEGFDSRWTNVNDNKSKLQTWFNTKANWSNLEDQLVKKLGSEKFKNVVLSQPNVTLETFTWNRQTWGVPTVTFNLAAKEGYEKAKNSTNTIALKIRVVYNSNNTNEILFPIQGASSSAAPDNTTEPNNAEVIKNVNVYLNYTGPAIMLNADLPTVGGQENTSINGTSNVTGDFNTKFKNLLVNVVGGSFTQTSLLQAIINYVNKFDPKYRAAFVTEKNGVALTSVQSGTQLRIGSLNDFLYNNKGFLQQIKGDTKAVYFAVNGVGDNKWLNTFLIRIPLTKFVRLLTEFQAQSEAAPTEETSGEQDSAPNGTGS
uniref:Variable lipoprotein hemagglutinin VlhA n=4 Tax=Mycoplasmopsis synoviae TaxID=2109 RepID=F2X2Z8_MYCSY|nr:variable lipoprotein hemagglutinin VlhA [Mycoplasmopsis synoviae]